LLTAPDVVHGTQVIDVEVRRASTSGASRLNFKAEMWDGQVIFFTSLTTTPLSRLMHAVCQRKGVNWNDVRFMFDGKRINEDQTPSDLDMEDGDTIDVQLV
jgi:small ubiquitin-related modifier